MKRRRVSKNSVDDDLLSPTSRHFPAIPEIFTQFLASNEDQRDFREFLDIIGLPDLNSYVDFIIQVDALRRSEMPTHESFEEVKREKCLVIYHRHIRSYATEKVNLDWTIRTKIESKLKSKTSSLDVHLFDTALQLSAQKLYKFLCHFYEKRN